MRDYSSYADRHSVIGYYNDNGEIRRVVGYYCQNGPEVDGHFNMRHGDVVGPGPHTLHPYYYIPEVGVSTSRDRIHEHRSDAVAEAREALLSQRADIDRRLANL